MVTKTVERFSTTATRSHCRWSRTQATPLPNLIAHMVLQIYVNNAGIKCPVPSTACTAISVYLQRVLQRRPRDWQVRVKGHTAWGVSQQHWSQSQAAPQWQERSASPLEASLHTQQRLFLNTSPFNPGISIVRKSIRLPDEKAYAEHWQRSLGTKSLPLVHCFKGLLASCETCRPILHRPASPSTRDAPWLCLH